jgi:hypothetical protein
MNNLLAFNLSLLNQNVDWIAFLEENSRSTELKLYQKIKSRLWSNSSEVDFLNKNCTHYDYYIRILNNLPQKVQILDFPSSLKYSKLSSVERFIHDELSTRMIILKRILKLKTIEYSVITDISQQNLLMIPTCSFFHHVQSLNNIILDSYYNLIPSQSQESQSQVSQSQELINRLLLRIHLLSSSSESVEDILSLKINFISIV